MAREGRSDTINVSPLITTIIPTYRRPKLLARAIRSVLNQTFQDFQVCVYDNASGDETAEVVAEFSRRDSRVKYHCHSKNIGAMANFNYGMSEVQTAFFSLLSDDDVLLPDFYQTALEGFRQYPDAIFSACSVISMTDKGEVINSQLSLWPREGYYTPPEGLLQMLGMKHPTWTGVLFRREVIQKLGFLDEGIGRLSDMDYELRIGALFPFVISQKPCAIFVHHPLSSSSLITLHSFWPGWLKVIRNLKEDERISMGVRIQVEEKLTSQLKSNLFATNLILRKEFGDAYRAADILRNYDDQEKRAEVLFTLTKVCEYFPPACSLLVGRMKIRAVLRRLRSRDLQKQFGHYARLLDLDGVSLNE
jgi:Glycosyl transferase family 2